MARFFLSPCLFFATFMLTVHVHAGHQTPFHSRDLVIKEHEVIAPEKENMQQLLWNNISTSDNNSTILTQYPISNASNATPIITQSRQLSTLEDEAEVIACNPLPTNGPQFIIGYGSLMQQASKDRTAPNTGENIPIRVRGYARYWNCKGSSIGFSTTYLGALATSDNRKSFVASAYRLSNVNNLKDFDARESFYCREEVPMSKISVATDKRRLANGQYWIYVTKRENTEEPSLRYPIVQSYVDTFLSGCIELEEKFNITNFSQECVQSTQGWDAGPWVNDRIFPRRASSHQPLAGKIDRLLHSLVPKAFKQIRIE